jgi:hypothetical protein
MQIKSSIVVTQWEEFMVEWLVLFIISIALKNEERSIWREGRKIKRLL